MLQVRRFADGGERPVADLLYDELHPPAGQCKGHRHPAGHDAGACSLKGKSAKLLQPVMRGGSRLAPAASLDEARALARASMRWIPRAELETPQSTAAIPFFVETGLMERRRAILREGGRDNG